MAASPSEWQIKTGLHSTIEKCFYIKGNVSLPAGHFYIGKISKSATNDYFMIDLI